jgi:Flp pilus assembly pilin Flp
MRNTLHALLTDESGATAIECGMLVAGMTVAIAASVAHVGTVVACALNKVRALAFGGVLQCR